MSEQLQLLRDLLPRLEEVGIAYMLSGSVALGFYAPPRMTRDVDIVVDLQPAEVDRLLGLFPAQTYYVDEAGVREAVRRRDMFNVIHLPTMLKLDFIVRKDAEYRRLELARRRPMRLGDVGVWVVSPEDLLLSKLAWSRTSRSELQAGDVQGLIASVVDLDWPYLERWAEALGLGERLREVRG